MASPPSCGLQLHAQADEIALDLGVHFVELVGGEIGGVGVQGVGCAAEVLQHDGGRRNSQPLLGHAGGSGHGVAGVVRDVDRLEARTARKSRRKRVDGGPSGSGTFRSTKVGSPSATSRFSRAALHQVLPLRRLDVVRVDLQHHLAVQFQRPLRREPGNGIAEAAIVVAALEIVMQPGEIETLLQRCIGGVLTQTFFVV